ncbi:GFA family protein [Novosphingobium sp. M1R2S20]|uniref:GFA family protein n=1 Tax=Novosphingobium rhizovicinum TaxID=3228928 RepID=A0ABV3RAI8_9SPHN
MKLREARCQCGQLRVHTRGEPVRVSVCHCLACQRRSGSVFAAQARFRSEQIRVSGEIREWSRKGDEGSTSVCSFCPCCGSTVYYRVVEERDVIAVAVGAFSDPHFPSPASSVYEARRHAWVNIGGEVEHHD